MNKNVAKSIKSVLANMALLVFCLIYLSPIYIIVVNSFKSRAEMYTNVLALPETLTWEYYAGAVQRMDFINVFKNSLIVTLCSVAVIVAAIIIATTGWQWADTVASIIIVAIIIPRAWQLLAQAGRVLMEQVPAGVDTAAIQRDIEALPGVIHAHDLHVWSVGGQDLVATVHVVADDGFLGATPPACSLLDSVQGLLRDRHSITHATVQIEHPGHAEHESGVC